ncbi:MAG: divalent-cation tolerance protein CutA [Calditrichaceae bacterium]|nr:divalent-cation tolerance protein CutA [Calditrichaceae bacterium]
MIIYCTSPSNEISEKIIKELLSSKVAACCSILPGIHSHYIWEGKIENQTEFLLMIKTREENFNTIEKIILDVHPYETPEILAVPVYQGNEKYISWINQVVMV